MSYHASALDLAEAQVVAVRDDPEARLSLLARTHLGPIGRAPHHLPFRRAAMSLMKWQVNRGVLNPLAATPPGSVWWRAINERLLRDGCESVALVGGLGGEPTSPAVQLVEVHREAHGTQLVTGSQRQHRGRLFAASTTRRI